MENSDTDSGAPIKQNSYVLREKSTDSNNKDPKKRKTKEKKCSTRIGKKDVCVIVCFILNIASIGVFIGYLMNIIVPSYAEDCNRVNEEPDESALCMECRFFPDKMGEEIRRYPRAGEEGGLCCSANLTVLLIKLYEKVRENKTDLYNNSFNMPAGSSDSGEISFDIDRDLWDTNKLKPFGHVTGVKLDSNNKCNGNLDVVASWPLKMIEYRSVVNGYVDRLTWGLTVPTNGVYRLHTAVNYYFSRGEYSNCTEYVVHQLSVYSAKDGSERKLTERNQTVATNHTDGLHSFLTALTRLEAGDIAFVLVSHSSAMKMQDGWHTEGLILVQ